MLVHPVSSKTLSSWEKSAEKCVQLKRIDLIGGPLGGPIYIVDITIFIGPFQGPEYFIVYQAQLFFKNL